MTMFRRGLAALAATLLAAGGAAWADGDLIRLGGTGDAKVSTLGFDGDADLLLTRSYGGHGGHHGHAHHGHVHHGHGHYGHVGHYGGYGRYYGGYGGYGRYYNGYGHYNGYGYNGYYRPYYASYYRPYYYASYYRPYFYGAYSYYRPYYYAPYYYYPYPYYYGYTTPYVVIAGSVGAEAPMYTLPAPTQLMPVAGGMPPANGAETYAYDGGSKTPVPVPGTVPGTVPSGPMPPAPMSKPEPRPTVPSQGRFVSLPTSTPYTFAAYGEQPATVVRTVGTTLRTSPTPTATSNNSFAYPAYGEQPST